jgi:hypothetical protein
MITISTALPIEAIKYNVQPQIFTSRQKGVNTIIGRPINSSCSSGCPKHFVIPFHE